MRVRREAALTQARSLMARYGLEQARHLVDFSYTAAQETDYRPQTFGGILQYTARARADYAQAQERAAAAQFDRAHTSPFGRDLLRRYALDDAVAAHFQLPSLAEWQATQGRG